MPDPHEAPPPTPPHAGVRHQQRRARLPQAPGPLQRSRNIRLVGGVAGGIATFVGAPTAAIRWLFVLAVPLTGGIAALIYLLLWLLLPLEPGGTPG